MSEIELGACLLHRKGKRKRNGEEKKATASSITHSDADRNYIRCCGISPMVAETVDSLDFREMLVKFTKGIEAITIIPGMDGFTAYEAQAPETTVLTPFGGGYGVTLSLTNENLEDLGDIYISITFTAAMNGEPIENGLLSSSVESEYCWYGKIPNNYIRPETDFTVPTDCPTLNLDGVSVALARENFDWEAPPEQTTAPENGNAICLTFHFEQTSPIEGAGPSDSIDISVAIELGTETV